MIKTQSTGHKVTQLIICGCGCDEPNLSQYFLTANKISRSPQINSQKLRNQNMGKVSKTSNIYMKTSINKGKISLKRGKEKLQSKIINDVKMSYAYEDRKQQRVRYSQGCYSEQDSPIHNLRNMLLDGNREQSTMVRMLESPKIILNSLPIASYALSQLSCKGNKKISLESMMSRLQLNGQKTKRKTENDSKNSLKDCSIDLQVLKDSQKRYQERILNQIKPNEFLSPVKSLTSLGNWRETKSISDEDSQDVKQSVVLGRLSSPQLPVLKTFSREETAAGSSMINKVLFSGEAIMLNQR